MPREKMDEFGSESLAPWELLAILLRVGVRGKDHKEDVIELSKKLISEFGFRGIFSQTDAAKLKESAGIFDIHSRTIAAVSEISRRLDLKFQDFDASTAEKIAAQFSNLARAKQEQCHILHIDRDGKAVFSEMVAMGGGNSVSVSTRDVFRTALWLGAEKIIIVHNHLGDPTASPEDILWTTEAARFAWSKFKIEIADHIIIGRDGYFSFSEKNLL